MFEDTVNGDLAEAGHTQKLISRRFINIDGEILRVAFGPGFFRVGIEGQVAGLSKTISDSEKPYLRRRKSTW